MAIQAQKGTKDMLPNDAYKYRRKVKKNIS